MTIIKEHLHRMQVIKAQNYIRDHLADKLTLETIAKKSGASPYHFIRLFSASSGETPFQFITRERIAFSLKRLRHSSESITDIAFECGFESSSSFNKAFKKGLDITPSQFRNLGEEQQDKFLYDYSLTPRSKEIILNFEMEIEPTVITRKSTVIYTVEETGDDFKIVAPKAWERFIPLYSSVEVDFSQSEFFGVGTMDKSQSTPVCTYKAAFSVPTQPDFSAPGLKREVLPDMKYARFLLKGNHENVWAAFEKAFQVITNSDFELADSPCLENYLNDPSITPVDDLRTEILIPIK